MRNFSCIESECEDTCCAGWQMHIDERTFKKYKKTQNHELTPLFNKKLRELAPVSLPTPSRKLKWKKMMNFHFYQRKNYVISN